MITAGVLVFLIIAGVGGGAWFYVTHVESAETDEQSAAREMAQVRERFKGVQPVFSMSARGPVVNRQPPARAGGNLQAIRVIGWNPDQRHLVHVTIPFWLFRLTPGNINILDGSEGTRTRVSLSKDELEGYGPTLLFDFTDEDGQHALIWSE